MSARSNSMPVWQKMLTWKKYVVNYEKLENILLQIPGPLHSSHHQSPTPWYLDTKRGMGYGNLHRKSLPQN